MGFYFCFQCVKAKPKQIQKILNSKMLHMAQCISLELLGVPDTNGVYSHSQISQILCHSGLHQEPMGRTGAKEETGMSAPG